MTTLDKLFQAIKTALPDVLIKQVETSHAGDDAGLWFVTHPNSNVEVNLESHNGEFPFLIENSRNDTRVTTTDIEETVAALRWTLSRYQVHDSSAA